MPPTPRMWASILEQSEFLSPPTGGGGRSRQPIPVQEGSHDAQRTGSLQTPLLPRGDWVKSSGGVSVQVPLPVLAAGLGSHHPWLQEA